MRQNLTLDFPKFEIFDFHRHAHDLDNFDENVKRYNITQFCLMPSIIEGDFTNLEAYFKKISPIHDKYGESCKIFGFLDFTETSEQNRTRIEQLRDNLSIKGIKIHPNQGIPLKKRGLKPYFDVIRDLLGMIPIYIHMDWPLTDRNAFAPNGKKNTFNKLVSFFPDFNFIMGHAGGSGDYLNVWKTCKKYDNVYVETSMAPSTSPLEEIIWNLGPERLLFGSNYPYCATSIELVKISSLYQITDLDRMKILHSNWRVVLEG